MWVGAEWCSAPNCRFTVHRLRSAGCIVLRKIINGISFHCFGWVCIVYCQPYAECRMVGGRDPRCPRCRAVSRHVHRISSSTVPITLLCVRRCSSQFGRYDFREQQPPPPLATNSSHSPCFGVSSLSSAYTCSSALGSSTSRHHPCPYLDSRTAELAVPMSTERKPGSPSGAQFGYLSCG